MKLWESDGTVDGTRVVLELPSDAVDGAVIGETLFYHDLGSLTSVPLNNRPANETLLIEPPATGAGSFPTLVNKTDDFQLYQMYSYQNSELWVTNGTQEGSVRLEGPRFDNFSIASAVLGDTLYFLGKGQAVENERHARNHGGSNGPTGSVRPRIHKSGKYVRIRRPFVFYRKQSRS